HPLVVCTPHLGASTKEAQNNVAKDIARQFLDIMNGKSVPGVVNAPLLSEMLKHQNLLWTRLGRNIGMVAAMDSPKARSLKISINGNEARKVAKLIRETVLVGFLSTITGKEVKLISASNLAQEMNVEAKLEPNDTDGHCCFSTVRLQTETGNEYVAIPQGRRSYLTEMNGHRFEPAIVMNGHLTIVELINSTDYEKMMKTMATNMAINSVTRSNDHSLVAIHSTESLSTFSYVDH
ncbi:D-3-phosphoglycerate dehydrogenase-like protein, partial [Euroglyphus maynei]